MTQPFLLYQKMISFDGEQQPLAGILQQVEYQFKTGGLPVVGIRDVVMQFAELHQIISHEMNLVRFLFTGSHRPHGPEIVFIHRQDVVEV